MHEFVSFNNEIISAKNSFLPAVSSAAFYGKGIFTTVAVYDGKPFLTEKHLRRLTDNAKKIDIDLSEYSEETIIESLAKIIEKNKIKNGRARLTFFDQSSGSIWKISHKRQTSFLITNADFRVVSANFRLAVSPFPVNSASPLAGVKSCNYLENVLALKDAQAKGFDEAVRQNERGEIVSACMANVFWIKNNEIFTPSLQTGCLAGTTRSFVLENFNVCEREAKFEELSEADVIFLTSAGIGIVQIAEFQNRKLGGEPHELTRILKPRTNGY